MTTSKPQAQTNTTLPEDPMIRFTEDFDKEFMVERKIDGEEIGYRYFVLEKNGGNIGTLLEMVEKHLALQQQAHEAELEKVKKDKELYALLLSRWLSYESSECRFDHHGNCQEHNCWLENYECLNEEIRQFFDHGTIPEALTPTQSEGEV